MSLFRATYDSIPPQVRRCALTIGNFDGVHLGHQAIIGELRRHAEQIGVPSVAVTFEPPPAFILRPDYQPVFLSTFEQRAELLQSYGVEHVVILATSRELLNLEANQFFKEILIGQFETQAIVEGTNFQFGRNRSGTQDLLSQWCRSAGVKLSIIADQILDGQAISSSVIRQQIAAGNVDVASRMLGRPHRIRGVVEHGLARGRTIGFPTANLGKVEVLVPGPGVYAARLILDNKPYAVAAHIGPNISFGEKESKVECHILEYEGDLYGEVLEVEFIEKIRDTMKFGSVNQLIAQMEKDVAKTATIAAHRHQLQ